jgi:hypothetical protein
MNKLLAMMLLAFVSGNAMAKWGANANWSFVDSTDDGVLFVDKSTIRKTGNMVKMWILFDFNNKPKHGRTSDRSRQSQDEFNCNDELWRERYSVSYSGNMGGGEVIDSFSTPTTWAPVGPTSIGKAMWNIACGRP